MHNALISSYDCDIINISFVLSLEFFPYTHKHIYTHTHIHIIHITENSQLNIVKVHKKTE